ncbi:MAG: 30S ribosomal protein S20 [Pseudomonadota bacterium]
MANTPQARKRVRQIAKRTQVNTMRRSRVRTFLRKVEEAIASGDQTKALEALKVAQPEIMRGAQKGIMHKNTASRKVSRLHQRIAKLAS